MGAADSAAAGLPVSQPICRLLSKLMQVLARTADTTLTALGAVDADVSGFMKHNNWLFDEAATDFTVSFFGMEEDISAGADGADLEVSSRSIHTHRLRACFAMLSITVGPTLGMQAVLRGNTPQLVVSLTLKRVGCRPGMPDWPGAGARRRTACWSRSAWVRTPPSSTSQAPAGMPTWRPRPSRATHWWVPHECRAGLPLCFTFELTADAQQERGQ